MLKVVVSRGCALASLSLFVGMGSSGPKFSAICNSVSG